MNYQLLRSYIKVIVLFYIIYSYFNWLLFTKLHSTWSHEILDVWIPCFISYMLVYLVIRPIVKKYSFSDNTKNLLLWVLLPIPMFMILAFSQPYFRDKTYKLIDVKTPGEINNYPNERFFKVCHYVVDEHNYFLARRQSRSGKNGTTLNVANYFATPMYYDSNEFRQGTYPSTFLCIEFKTSMSNAMLQREKQPEKIKLFNIRSLIKYKAYNFYKANTFEKLINPDNTKNYYRAVGKLNFKKEKPLLLKHLIGGLPALSEKNKQLLIFGSLCPLLFMILLIGIIDISKKR